MTPGPASPQAPAAALVIALAAALISAPAPASRPVSAASDTWTEIRGTDFRLIGHSSPERLGKVACDLERASAALRPMRPALTPFTTPVVIAAAGERDMRELLPQFWEQRGARPVGAYWGGAFGHHVVVRIDAPQRARFRRILHEYAHFVTHVRGTEPPPWLDEGLSELWTHATIDAGQIVLGRSVKPHLTALGSDDRWIPVRELTSAAALPAATDPKRVARFYAASWALVHYLVAGQPGGLQNAADINRTTLPTDEILRAYIRSGRLPTLTLPDPDSDVACGASARTLPTSESLVLRSRALADSPRPESAEPLLRQLLAEDPGNPAALEALGLVHFLGNQPIQAQNSLDLAIATGKASHVAYYYRAVQATGAKRPADAGVPVADYMKRALALTPDFQPARDRLAELQHGR